MASSTWVGGRACKCQSMYVYGRYHPSLLAGRCRDESLKPCPPADGVGEVQFFNNLDTRCPSCLVRRSGGAGTSNSKKIDSDKEGFYDGPLEDVNVTMLVKAYLTANAPAIHVGGHKKSGGGQSQRYFFFNHIATERLGEVWNFEKSPHYLDSAAPGHLRVVMPGKSSFVLSFVVNKPLLLFPPIRVRE